MIDALDSQTQALNLEEQPAKPKRGRPATGKALSNADRQRAYRERQKSQRNENAESHAVSYDEVVSIAQELGERCKKAEARVKELEKQLAQRNEIKEGEMPGVWIVEVKRRGTRSWKPCGDPESSLVEAKKSVNYMQFESGSGRGEEWRALRADGMIYWPLWSKTKAPK
jgi:hypothetical protein